MNILTILIVLALLATIVSLVAGVGSMMRGGEYDRTHADKFMFSRVGFQGIALVLLVLALVVGNP